MPYTEQTLLSTQNNIETCASKKLGGIKSTPSPPAAQSDREQHLQSRNQRRKQELNPLPQIHNEEGATTPQQDNQSATNSLHSTQYFTIDFVSLVNNPKTLRTPHQYSERFNKMLDIRIDAQKSYFESKFSQERDEYALKLAQIEKKYDKKFERIETDLVTKLEHNAERAVQNKIKDSLIQLSTARILSDLTELLHMEKMVDTIVNRK